MGQVLAADTALHVRCTIRVARLAPRILAELGLWFPAPEVTSSSSELGEAPGVGHGDGAGEVEVTMIRFWVSVIFAVSSALLLVSSACGTEQLVDLQAATVNLWIAWAIAIWRRTR